ncbi:MAG: MBL fold metallo-hydrolase [Candidatus Gracilibacteria bacterium]|nr:MBL fold metallo-hydrolase [Candidatus Gracilibacteria bacterium]
MYIDYLGHSEFIVEIAGNNGKKVKILSDAWLSNYSFGDMMERNPMIKLDISKLQDLSAIFISHAHTDHFDPYTLLELYQNIKPRPVLLIPETISFLVPLLEKNLPKQTIKILKNREVFEIDGVSIEGIIFENVNLTNEDDVMTLAISNSSELVYAEVDTLPPNTEEAQEILYDVFTKKDYKTALYMATRNELEGNLKLLDFNNLKDRKNFAFEYIANRKEEIAYDYEKFEDELVECSNIKDLPYYMQSFIGQGIIYPTVINPEFQKISILGLDEETDIERGIAKKFKKNFPLTYFVPGKRYEILPKSMKEIGNIPYMLDIKYSNPKKDIDIELFRTKRNSALHNEKRNPMQQEAIILDLLNNRFLPYRMANLEDSFKNVILNTPDHKYIIKVIYGSSGDYFYKYYTFDFSKTKFSEEKSRSEAFSEDYFANDLEDFFNGRQELYSNFLHDLHPKRAYRFWTALGANFLNNDLVIRKYDFHFKRAQAGMLIDDYVLKFYKK